MLYRRRDIKRMFAYSSIEHMGIIVFAFGMGGPLANFAGLLHMTMHSLTKSAIFFAVGHIAQVKGTQKIADIRGLTVTHPVLGWSLVVGVVAIVGMPPFGIFMSEFLIVTSTFAREPLLALALVGGLLVAFGALVLAPAGTGFRRAGGAPAPGPGVLSADGRASRAGPDRRDLSAAAAGRLVPARRRHARIGDPKMASLAELISRGRRVEAHRPGRDSLSMAISGARWPKTWPQAKRRCSACGATPAWSIWPCSTEPEGRHLRRHASTVREGYFPSVGRIHPPAIRFERTIRDLYGLRAARGGPIQRPWLDHGRWGVRYPLAGDARRPRSAAAPYPFLATEGEGLHQIPVGPVHAGIIEPGHFRFTANGETIVRLEERLGYAHKGVEGLMAGRVARARRATGWTDVGRQHGRLFARLRARRRSGARDRSAAARGLAARADGRTGTPRQPFRRHRRDLQRRRLRADARPLRRFARTRACARRRLVSAIA